MCIRDSYHVGLNVTGAALLVRGVAQVLALPLSRACLLYTSRCV